MRQIRYTVEPGVGEATETEGNVADLLESIPYLLTDGLVPPLHLLNALLRLGDAEAGMSGGCGWEPFELSTGEFRELVDELEARPPDKGRCRFVEPPEWVGTLGEWRIWCAEYLHSIPADQNRTLLSELESLEAAMKKAEESGEHELAHELFSKLQRAAQAYADFIRRQRDTTP